MKKILFVFAEPFEFGGQEAFARNVYNNIDKRLFNIDFFTPYSCSDNEMIEKMSNDGNELYYCNKKFNSRLRKYFFISTLKTFLSNHNQYDIVHINSGSTFALAEGAKICKKNGISNVIVHSHATGISSVKHSLTNYIIEPKFKYADQFLACSKEAAQFRFPKDIIDANKYEVIVNGIDFEKYKFDNNIRKNYRESLGINLNDFVIGNVGRLSEEKNHDFLIDVFMELVKEQKNAKLLIIGDGILKEKILNKIMFNKLEDNFILLSGRKDVNNLLQAMDVFVFPSVYEGLGIAAIEAQANGLPTICSQAVPDVAKICPNFIKLNLSDGIARWKNKILEFIDIDRKNINENLEESEFNIKKTVMKLERIYNEM